MARFTGADGKRYQRSTGTRDRSAARKIAEGFEAMARGRRTADQIRKVASGLVSQICGIDLPSKTTRAFCEHWLSDKKPPKVSPATEAIYKGAVKKFLASLGEERAERNLADITLQDLQKHRREMFAKLATATASRESKIVKMIMGDAYREGFIEINPADRLPKLKKGEQGKQSSRQPWTLPEIKRILEHCDPEWRSIVLFGLHTGQRLGDIARLTWANFDLERGELFLIQGKTKKRISIPLSQQLQEHLEAASSSDDPKAPIHPKAFESVQKTGRTGHLSNWFTDILCAAGLREGTDHGKRVGAEGRSGRRAVSEKSFHSLRHSAVSLLKEQGVPDAVVMELVGHETVEMSRHYSHIGREALKKAVATLPQTL